MSPSRISDSGTCSIACSELIVLPDRRDRSSASAIREIDPAIILRMPQSTPPVNHSFTCRRFRGLGSSTSQQGSAKGAQGTSTESNCRFGELPMHAADQPYQDLWPGI